MCGLMQSIKWKYNCNRYEAIRLICTWCNEKIIQTYLVPKHWAVAVGSRTKLAQKQKKIPQTQTAKRGLLPNWMKLKVMYNMDVQRLTTVIQFRYPYPSHRLPQKIRPVALKMAARAPTMDKKWSSIIYDCPYA